MRCLQPKVLSNHHLAWLLGLMLLLPLAQASATWHLLSHLHAGTSQPSRGDPASQVTHCDIDLVATAVVGSAPVAQAITWARFCLPALPPACASVLLWTVRLLHPYQSRAPPVVSH